MLQRESSDGHGPEDSAGDVDVIEKLYDVYFYRMDDARWALVHEASIRV